MDIAELPSRTRARSLLVANEIGLQIAREAPELLVDDLVATDEEVIEQHGRDGGEEADGGGDEGLSDGTRDLVDRGLTGKTDCQKGGQDAPHRAQQSHE